MQHAFYFRSYLLFVFRILFCFWQVLWNLMAAPWEKIFLLELKYRTRYLSNFTSTHPFGCLKVSIHNYLFVLWHWHETSLAYFIMKYHTILIRHFPVFSSNFPTTEHRQRCSVLTLTVTKTSLSTTEQCNTPQKSTQNSNCLLV